jgi:hypothetical protein
MDLLRVMFAPLVGGRIRSSDPSGVGFCPAGFSGRSRVRAPASIPARRAPRPCASRQGPQTTPRGCAAGPGPKAAPCTRRAPGAPHRSSYRDFLPTPRSVRSSVRQNEAAGIPASWNHKRHTGLGRRRLSVWKTRGIPAAILSSKRQSVPPKSGLRRTSAATYFVRPRAGNPSPSRVPRNIEGCPRQESNLRTRFRKPLLYPLSYGGVS